MIRSSCSTPRILGCLTLLVLLATVQAVQAEYLGNITFDIQPSSFLPNDQYVNVSIDYKIDDPAGRRIYITPYTDGAPSPNYIVGGSAVLPPGTGTVTRAFSITSGDVIVDEMRVAMRDPEYTETPLEMFVPVVYQFGPHGVFNVQPNHSQYSHLRHGMSLSMTFDYAVDAPGCRITARPWNGSHLEPGYTASGSAVLPPSGSYSQSFQFAGDADISHIRFRVVDLNGDLLDEFFIPWDCHWREWGLYDISFNHDTLTSLHNSQYVVGSFTVDHVDSDGCWVWIRCYQDGWDAPGSSSQPSINEPIGPHTTTRYARVYNGTQRVDNIRIQVGDLGGSFYEFDIPLVLDYGPHALQNFEFTPAAPAILSHGERLEMTYDYHTDHSDGVRIFGRAAFGTTALWGQSNPGLPISPPPSGSEYWWMSYNQDRTATAVRFQMHTPDESEVVFEWFEQGGWIWSAMGHITEVEPTPPVAMVDLGPCYPNPFNPTTTIPVLLNEDTHVRLSVFDLRGRLVRTLQDGTMPAGDHAFTLRGDGLGSGAYICRLETRYGVQTQRLTLVK